jgi:Flp pilus assembly CpaF family ATPase
MALLLEGLAKSKINMLISGGTGSGKTTLLNILSGFIPKPNALSPSKTRRNYSCSRSM